MSPNECHKSLGAQKCLVQWVLQLAKFVVVAQLSQMAW